MTPSAPQDHYIHLLVRDLLPDIYAEDPAGLVTFIEAYYEWLASVNYDYKILSYSDIDTTLDQFVDHFRQKYMDSIPSNIKADPRLLTKHILDLYRSKGTIRGTKLLFRLIFGEEIDVYYPSQDILTASGAEWFVPEYIEIDQSPLSITLEGKLIVGASSGATAIAERYITMFASGRQNDILYLSNIKGTFVVGEKVTTVSDAGSTNVSNYPTIVGSLQQISFTDGGSGHEVGEIIKIVNGSGIEGELRITKTVKGTGSLGFEISNGGTGYTVNSTPILSRPSPQTGGGGSFAVGSVSSIEQLDINTDLLINFVSKTIANTTIASVTRNANGTGYSNSDTLIFTPTPVISNVLIVNQGSGYNNTDTVFVSNTSGTGFTCTLTTNNSGSIVEVDVLTVGQGYGNTPVLTVNTSTGTGAVLAGVIETTGSNAAATITTNATGSITSITLSNGGIDFLAPPVVTVNTAGGTGANLTAVLGANAAYGFVANPAANISTSIANSLTIIEKSFGTISSLTSIVPGNNYVTAPSITIGEYIYSPDQIGNISFTTSSNTITGNGTFFQSIFNANDIVRLVTGSSVDHRRITAVTSNTSIQVDDVPTYSSNSSSKFQLAVPVLRSNYTVDQLTETNGTVKGENAIIVASTFYGNGVIAQARVINSGFGYNDNELVTLAPYGTIDSISVIDGGTLYANGDNVIITAARGKGAVASIITDANGTIASVNVASGGTGYVVNPTLTIDTANGVGGRLFATIGGPNLSEAVKGRIVAEGKGVSRGRFISTKSFLNSDKYLQDSYYYQNFSYEIRSSMTLNKYANSLKQLFHPAGTQLFGKVVTRDYASTLISNTAMSYSNTNISILDFSGDSQTPYIVLISS